MLIIHFLQVLRADALGAPTQGRRALRAPRPPARSPTSACSPGAIVSMARETGMRQLRRSPHL